jgi:X-X-X-Leu-X-X-Gly heptad repeat protein
MQTAVLHDTLELHRVRVLEAATQRLHNGLAELSDSTTTLIAGKLADAYVAAGFGYADAASKGAPVNLADVELLYLSTLTYCMSAGRVYGIDQVERMMILALIGRDAITLCNDYSITVQL